MTRSVIKEALSYFLNIKTALNQAFETQFDFEKSKFKKLFKNGYNVQCIHTNGYDCSVVLSKSKDIKKPEDEDDVSIDSIDLMY